MYQSRQSLTEGNVGLTRPTPREEGRYLRPTSEESLKEILVQTQHSSSVEYYKHHLKHGFEDTQTPHDLEGKGNKFEPEVLRYISLEFRIPKVPCEVIQIGVDYHRAGQDHHKRVNGFDLAPDATVDFLLEGMVDVACAIRQNRHHARDKANNFNQVYDIFMSQRQPTHKILTMGDVIEEMIELEKVGYGWPNLDSITMEQILGDKEFKNHYMLPEPIQQSIVERVNWAVGMVNSGGYERAWDAMDSGLVVPDREVVRQ